MKVLVVESSMISREDLCSELMQLHLATGVRSAASVEGAEEILQTFQPQVLFVDMQLPDQGAFRLVDRSWTGDIPVIVCITIFDRELLATLTRHHVEYLVRPFSPNDLHYVMTRGRRPEPIDPARNLRNLLDAAACLNYPVNHSMASWLDGRLQAISIANVAAIRYDSGRYYLWTEAGTHITMGIGPEVDEAVQSRLFTRVHKDAFVATRLTGKEYRQARRWLHWHGLKRRISRLLPEQLRAKRRSRAAVHSITKSIHD